RDRAARASREGPSPRARAARAAVDDPEDLEREDPTLAPGGDDPHRGASRADRRRLTCGSAAVCIAARARNVRGWPDRDAFRLPSTRLWTGGDAGDVGGLCAAGGGGGVRLAVGQRPCGAAVAHRLALSLQRHRRLPATTGHGFSRAADGA